jgi:protein-S-isoprenylcysteine O-methyltransferase Ste14
MKKMNEQLKNDPRYKNHESRPDLAGEHPQGDRYQLYVFLLFTVAVLIDHFFLGWASGFRSIIPFLVRLPFATLIVVFGLFLSLSGIHTVFSEYTEYPRMITTGLFSNVRHPVYLGALMVYIGMLIFLLSPLALLVSIGVFFLYDWLAKDEEERMLKVFGSRYEDYCRLTPKWLPRLFRRN